MNQVGDLYTFVSAGTLPGSATPAYVWKFWDASVAVAMANQGTVVKKLNLGGNPAEGGANGTPGPPYVIPYRCEICDPQRGEVVAVIPGTLAVNNPPSIYGSPTVTPNNTAFPFTATITVQAYDLEESGVSFAWYYGATSLGGGSTVTGPQVAGTYGGTLTGVARTSFVNTFAHTFSTPGVYTCKLTDGDGGVRLLHVPIQGYDPAAPQFSVAATPAGVTIDATSLPDARIGQVVVFTSYAYDPAPGSISFTWSLLAAKGWTVPQTSAGVTTALAKGVRNEFACSTSGEVGTGIRTARVTALNTSTGKSATTEISVNLVQNNAPVFSSVGLYSATTGQPITSTQIAAPPAKTMVRYTGTASDANDDVVIYKWTLTTASTDILSNYTMYGRDCYVDVTSWGTSVQYNTIGYVIAIDKYGAESLSFPMPGLYVAPTP